MINAICKTLNAPKNSTRTKGVYVKIKEQAMSASEKYAHKTVKKLVVKLPDQPGQLGVLSNALGECGIMIGDIKSVGLCADFITREIMLFGDSEEHFDQVKAALEKLPDISVLEIADVVMEVHRGGKLAIVPTCKLDSINDLRIVYTPGVAKVCKQIEKNPELAKEFTTIGNTVCIATNGSAVLGLGNIGVEASMPVMEGKSVILNKMAGVNCAPILIDSDNPDVIADTLAAISKTYSVIMIEDIKAPLCFEIEERLENKNLKIPYFHDDQHGTAIVVLAALIQALKLTGKAKENVKVAVNGAGAAGSAVTRLLLEYGFKNIIVCDGHGSIYKNRAEHMDFNKERLAEQTNPDGVKGDLKTVIKGADIFIGLSIANLVSKEMVQSMNEKPIVFGLANPVPEIWPQDAIAAGAAIALDGRNINNALAFPGLMRGTLDARAPKITTEMKIAAAKTIASLAGDENVIPDFMDLSLHKTVASEVAKAALKQFGK